MYLPNMFAAGVFLKIGPPHAQSVVSAIGSRLPNWKKGFEEDMFFPQNSFSYTHRIHVW